MMIVWLHVLIKKWALHIWTDKRSIHNSNKKWSHMIMTSFNIPHIVSGLLGFCFYELEGNFETVKVACIVNKQDYSAFHYHCIISFRVDFFVLSLVRRSFIFISAFNMCAVRTFLQINCNTFVFLFDLFQSHQFELEFEALPVKVMPFRPSVCEFLNN